MKRILSSVLVATGGKVGGNGCGRSLVSPAPHAMHGERDAWRTRLFWLTMRAKGTDRASDGDIRPKSGCSLPNLSFSGALRSKEMREHAQ